VITPCRFIYPYYENKTMLQKQVENWNRYAGELRKAVRIIIVDDCSSTYPAYDVLKDCKVSKQLWKVTKRIPWNMHQCRNIGAKVAYGEDKDGQKEDGWMFMSDIDIILTPEMAYTMLSKELEPEKFYTMERTFAPDFKDRKIHPNTFLVRHSAYWQINGYDLDLTPVGGGGYGGDGEFVRQLSVLAQKTHMQDVVLVGYGRRERKGEPYLHDADTRDLDRDEWQKKYREAFDKKRVSGDMRSIRPIRTPFERIPL
jgi:hypothetical protein